MSAESVALIPSYNIEDVKTHYIEAEAMLFIMLQKLTNPEVDIDSFKEQKRSDQLSVITSRDDLNKDDLKEFMFSFMQFFYFKDLYDKTSLNEIINNQHERLNEQNKKLETMQERIDQLEGNHKENNNNNKDYNKESHKNSLKNMKFSKPKFTKYGDDEYRASSKEVLRPMFVARYGTKSTNVYNQFFKDFKYKNIHNIKHYYLKKEDIKRLSLYIVEILKEMPTRSSNKNLIFIKANNGLVYLMNKDVSQIEIGRYIYIDSDVNFSKYLICQNDYELDEILKN